MAAAAALFALLAVHQPTELVAAVAAVALVVLVVLLVTVVPVVSAPRCGRSPRATATTPALIAVLAGFACPTSRWQANPALRSGTPDSPTAKRLRLLPFGTVPLAALPLAAGVHLVTATTWTWWSESCRTGWSRPTAAVGAAPEPLPPPAC